MILAKNYLTKAAQIFMNFLAIFKHITFYVETCCGLLFWQILETIWLLFIPTSGHTTHGTVEEV